MGKRGKASSGRTRAARQGAEPYARSAPADAERRAFLATSPETALLVRRFVCWQQQHSWRKLEAVERIWAVSDLHMEHEANVAFVRSLNGYEKDALIVAGDVCSSLLMLRGTLQLLVQKFRHVFYCVGNHDLWLDLASDGADSFDKLMACYEIATEVGAHSAPALIGKEGDGLVVFPLQSWYHFNFLEGGPLVDMPSDHELRLMDSGCQWPRSIASSSTKAELAILFAKCNEDAIAVAGGLRGRALPRDSKGASQESEGGVRRGRSLITFSHFLPRAELHRTHPTKLADRLGNVEGSLLLGEQASAFLPLEPMAQSNHGDQDGAIESRMIARAFP